MLKKYSNALVNVFYVPLIFISLVGIIAQSLSQLINISRWGVLLIDVTCLFAVIFYFVWLIDKINIIRVIEREVNKHYKIFVVALSFIIILWQVYLVICLSGFSRWDPGIIILQAMRKSQWVPNYFSYNQNTLFLMFYEHLIWIAFGKPNIQVLTLVLNVLSLIILDFSMVIFIKITIRNCNNRVAKGILIFSIPLIIITPWYCLPYSDILSFSLSIFTFRLLYELSKKAKISKSVTLGILFVIDYLVKPSIVIVFIAFLIVTLIFNSKINKHKIIGFVIVILVSFLGITSFNFYKDHNSVVSIDNSKALSVVHFADMGIQGTGGYYLPDVQHDCAIKNPITRKNEDIRIWKQRFQAMGGFNYQKFLVKKQIANTADASFNWGKEGTFITPYAHKGKFVKLAWKLFAKNGVATGYNGTILLIEQIIWGLLFFFMLFNVRDSSYLSQLLKYTVVGFFLFLLIFEAGRSRYLIQCLPYFLLLSSIGFSHFRKLKL